MPSALSERAADAAQEHIANYLSEIGGVPLLTRAGEQDLGRALELGLFVQSVRNRLQLGGNALPSARDVLAELAVAEPSVLTQNVELVDAAELEQYLVDLVLAGQRARLTLIGANLRLVVSVAKKFPTNRLSLLDLIQEGNIGLMRAAEKFEYRKGFKFSTYATWWIRQAILRALNEQGRMIRVPSHTMDSIGRLSRVTRRLELDLGREPLDDELAEELGLAAAQVRELRSYGQDPVSLEAPTGADGEGRIGDYIPDAVAANPLELAAAAQRSEHIGSILDSLPGRDGDVLRRRFGFVTGEQQTLDAVARALSLSRERVRQIEARALRRLRQAPAMRRWRESVDD